MSDLSCHVSKVINAPIEKVFDAWLDPEILSQFMLPMPGMPQPKTEIDARPGGRFTILMDVGDEVIPHSGTYLEIERPNRLVFSWESPFSTDGSTVTLGFTAEKTNSTRVELTHEKFPDQESCDNHLVGWGNILNVLGEVCR
jgi:uncharacterized protein YndB with AHSA1/START domain